MTTTKPLAKVPEVAELQKRWLTIASAAEYCDLSQETLRRMISSGKLTPHRPVKGRILLDRFEIDSVISVSTSTPRTGRGIR